MGAEAGWDVWLRVRTYKFPSFKHNRFDGAHSFRNYAGEKRHQSSGKAATGSQKQEQPRAEVGLSLTDNSLPKIPVTLDRSNWALGLVV